MRRAVTRAVVSATAILTIAAGSLLGSGAGAGFAAAQPATAEAPTASSGGGASVLLSENFGLTIPEGMSVQCFVRDRGFNPGAIDGVLGANSWRAWQGYLNRRGYNAGAVDGIPGPNTVRALQRFLVHDYHLDTGGIDGIAGTRTRAAWKTFARLPYNDHTWC